MTESEFQYELRLKDYDIALANNMTECREKELAKAQKEIVFLWKAVGFLWYAFMVVSALAAVVLALT